MSKSDLLEKLGSDLVNYHLGLANKRGHLKPAFFALCFFNEIFGRPMRVVRGSAPAARNSQAVVNVFQTEGREVLVVGWLRSSQESEIAEKTGTLTDRRPESVFVSLPCTNPQMNGYYDAVGHPQKSSANVRGGSPQDFPLRGDSVLVAKLSRGGKGAGAANSRSLQSNSFLGVAC